MSSINNHLSTSVTAVDDDDDDDIIMTQQELGIKCPYTQQVMKNPVMNKKCRHNYEKDAIFEFIALKKGNARLVIVEFNMTINWCLDDVCVLCCDEDDDGCDSVAFSWCQNKGTVVFNLVFNLVLVHFKTFLVCRCPYAGCANLDPLTAVDLENNDSLREYIEMKQKS